VLGAPILEVQASVQQTAAPAGSTPVTTGGTVSANNVVSVVQPTITQIGGAVGNVAVSLAALLATLLGLLI